MTRSERDNTICVKFVIFVQGIIILGVGLHAYINSEWTNKTSSKISFPGNKSIPSIGYKVCQDEKTLLEMSGLVDCPQISLEHFYLAIIIVTFAFSLIGLVWDFGRIANITYHGMSSVLLLIGGIVYIISAIQIDDLVKWAEWSARAGSVKNGHDIGVHIDYLKSEKLVAGILTINQSLFYAVVAFLQLKRRSDGDGRRRLWIPSSYIEINEVNSPSSYQAS